MNKIDEKWAREQLVAAGYTTETVAQGTVQLCTLALIKELNNWVQTPESIKTIVEVFSELASSRALVSGDAPEVQGQWVPFLLGDVPLNAQIRVKKNAYPGVRGQQLNGKVGRFNAARNGQVLVTFEGDATNAFSTRHEPKLLEWYKE